MQLGGEPDLNPKHIFSRSRSEYAAEESLRDMLKEDLEAEGAAIESYAAMADYFKMTDPASQRLMEEILGKEAEHCRSLTKILATLGPEDEPPPERREDLYEAA